MSISTLIDPAAGVAVIGPQGPRFDEILTPAALAFLAELHRAFDKRRRALLEARMTRQKLFDAGDTPDDDGDGLYDVYEVAYGTDVERLMPELLEVVRAETTSDETLASALQFAKRIGKEAIVVRDVAGFASSRLGLALVMMVVLNDLGASGSRRAIMVSVLVRNSNPMRALRFRSNSTSSLPLAGRLA